jgi:cation diffusion facilitator CzcD-associated flavoprotein CzcO
MSSAYRSLQIDTSPERMEYSGFPMPSSYPDFPHHTEIARYFDRYVDHFGFCDREAHPTVLADFLNRIAERRGELEAERGRARRRTGALR